MSRQRLDLRLAPAAATTWLTAALAAGWGPRRSVLAAAVLLVGGVLLLLARGIRWRRHRTQHRTRHRTRHSLLLVVLAGLVVGAGALATTGLRAAAVGAGPIPELATQRAYVHLTARVAGDPYRRTGRYEPYIVVALTVEHVTHRGVRTDVRTPVLLIGDTSWSAVHLGDRVRLLGRLHAARGHRLAAVVVTHGDPMVVRRAGPVWQGVAVVREGLLEATRPLPRAEGALVPGLVDGDTSRMPDDLAADFRIAGLTHLVAVSGTNLTLMLGFVLFVARWCRIRGYGLLVVGLVGVVFFVLLARPQPSVLRAAAMGVVGLAGLSAGGPRKGFRALCLAVIVLVLVQPSLARSPGFILSTLATAGILLLTPGWRDSLARWMPRWLAEAVAVPLAAQLMCTPVIAALSGRVSLVAVAANLAVAPAVGPATVVGLVAGLVAVVSATLGHLLGWVAGAPAWWIVWVARHAASLAGASLTWPAGPFGIAVLAVMCLAVVLVMRPVLRRPVVASLAAGALAVAVVHPVNPGRWPPRDWVMVACDVGQGDGLVLNAGGGTAVVVDTGMEPEPMGRCLDALDVDHVPLVVLTHFHADHIGGLSAVLQRYDVDRIEVSPLDQPDYGAREVQKLAAEAGVPVTAAVAGESGRLGTLRWTVLGPRRVADTGDDAADPNNASVVLRVQTRGATLLLAGDAQHEEQRDIVASGVDLRADVLKVAHHGSADQDPDFIAATQARFALVSVGADNDYGHPAAHTLALLQALPAQVFRTDRDGSVAVVVDSGEVRIVTAQ